MSVTVFAIAAAHAIPVVGAAIFSGRGAALVTALVMSPIAIITGGMQYAVFDLVAICLAYYACSRT